MNSKSIFLTISSLFIFFFHPSLKAEEFDSLFVKVSISELDTRDREKYEKIIYQATTKQYELVRINDFIIGGKQIINLLSNNIFVVNFERNGNYYKIRTEIDDLSGSFLLKNNKVHGILHYNSEIYEIVPLNSKVHVIKLIDQAKITPEKCNFENQITDSSEIVNPKEKSKVTLLNIGNECNIRVLVAYTPASSDERGGIEDINGDIEWAIFLTNQSYENSAINQRVELVRTIETNYTESGSWGTDRNRFFSFNDGFMDELPQIRDNFSADFVVLILNDPSWCGEAATIMSDGDNAYCIISASSTCLTSYFSFAHELGHLMGARHNPESDNNNSPFAYGHGYCFPNGGWRTIMSYDNNCATRLQFWSNPNILFNNNPMGTSTRHNNARVLNETENIVREFRITPTNYSIPNEIISEFDIADLLAKSVLSTSTNFIASSNSQVNFRAGDEVILNPGFHSTSGSNFHAFIESCSNNNFQKISRNMDNSNLTSISTITIHPNPFTEDTRISISLSSPDIITLTVYDLLGNRIAILAEGTELSAGIHNFTFSGHNINSGVYYVVMSSSTERISRSLMLIK